MNIELIYKVSSITVIVATIVGAFAGVTQYWTSGIISKRQDGKIEAMEKSVRVNKANIFSQKIISQNIPNEKLFTQKYLISINSPIQHTPLYTYIQYDIRNGDIERVGEMGYSDIGGGVRQVEGQDVSYIDTEYTLNTNRALNENEGIIFSLEKQANIPVLK